MGTTTTALLTFEEFERLPEYPGEQELLEGELIELPPADLVHHTISEEIFLRFRSALLEAQARGEAAELGKAHHEMGYRLSNPSYVIPVVSVTHAGQAAEKYLGGAPAIAVEVISPSNTAEAIKVKTELYFQYGAREVWHVYPKTRDVVVHIAGNSRTEQESLRTPLLPGFTLNIREILGV